MQTSGSKAAVVLGLVVCALAWAGRGAGAERPAARDVWYVHVAGDQQFGCEHVTVRRQEDGTLSYQVETRLLLNFLGQRQEITEKGKYVVTPKYAPVSLDVESVSPAGTTRLQGRVEGGKLALVQQRGGQRRTAPIDLSGSPMFRACLDDWLSGQPAGTAKATCRVINESSLELEPAVATLVRADRSGAVWNVDLGAELGQGQLTFDPEGVRREYVCRVPPLRLRRATAEEAGKIRHRGFETLPRTPAKAPPKSP